MDDELQSTISVSLWSGQLPRIGLIAEHCWLTVSDGGRCDRWEVWQSADNGGESWGHLHRNLMPIEAWPHGVPRLIAKWTEGEAESLAARIKTSPESYPWVDRYLIVPGPNSNTYVQWVLGNKHRLGWKAWGRGYSRKCKPQPSKSI